MNAAFYAPLFLFSLACLILFPAVALSADGFLQANLVMEFVADRARMVQVSLVIVALGCALLWWRR